MDKFLVLKSIIQPCLSDLPVHSRIHSLHSFSHFKNRAFVKRDDELSFGISGSKMRKYASLIPYLKEKSAKKAILIGSPYSNNILGLTQLFIENKIEPIYFLLENSSKLAKGNYALLQCFIDQTNIHWIPRQDWPRVNEIAKQFSEYQKHAVPIIPEGADLESALPGAMTLVLDIIENERFYAIKFDQLYLDAGTGFTAIASIIALAFLERNMRINILLLADTQEQFIAKLWLHYQLFKTRFSLEFSLNAILNQLHFYQPNQAKSFGATSPNLFRFIREIAQKEGFLTDPIYSAKLFLFAKEKIKEYQSEQEQHHLIVHSGGALSLTGFMDKLK